MGRKKKADAKEPTDEEKAMLEMLEAENNTPDPPKEETKKEEKKPPAKKAATKPPAKPNSDKFSMWEWIKAMIGYNVGMIFSDTGGGKSKTCQQIAYECAKEGKKVYYIDHEANFSERDKDTMVKAGITYKLMADRDELYDLNAQKVAGYDLIIIDSATLAVTGSWAKLDMSGRGTMLQRLQGMVYRLSQHCIKKEQSIVLITAQPTSVMGDKTRVQPVGDKLSYLCKEIYYIKAPKDKEGFVTSREMIAFRSRSLPDRTVITKIETQKFGAKFDIKNMQKVMKEV